MAAPAPHNPNQGAAMSGLELFAAAIGVIAVWLTVKQNPWCWPIGLVMVVIYIWIFFDVKLYSDMLLQVIYAGLQIYGWLQWTRHGDGLPVKAVTVLPSLSALKGLAVGAVISLALSAGMAHFTDAAQPWLDAALTGFSLVAQVWMAHKRVQCWPLWIVLDVIFVGLFIYKELYLTAALYALFTLLAVQGWREWRNDLALAR
ncbi:Nicotinamide mononucleotide transporter PnuC [Pseudomonas meliae]|uniref:Nicotinamide riboside transporter PnuC n=2 Tax=Pseudomonas meliae TaxID=86176 RepID=A0A0N8S2E6_9PSED|nr:Nicotinamide mononucleotide transporter PnuC [Pseudomonas meliae]